MRFTIVTNHGERQTIYSVVDTLAPADEQPAVVATYGTAALGGMAPKAARLACDTRNERERRTSKN